MVTLSWLLIIGIAASALAIFDGLRRLRGHHSNSVLAIAEIVFAVLMLVSLFIDFPSPLGTLVFAIGLEVVLILLLVLRGTRRGGVATITIIALILNTVYVLIKADVLNIAGIG